MALQTHHIKQIYEAGVISRLSIIRELIKSFDKESLITMYANLGLCESSSRNKFYRNGIFLLDKYNVRIMIASAICNSRC